MADRYGIDMGSVMDSWDRQDTRKAWSEDRNYLTEQRKRQDSEQDIVRAAGREAVDPATGAYDPAKHLANLERAGYPEVAMKFRAEQQQNLTRSLATFEKIIPFANEQTWPKVRELLASQGFPAQFIPEQFDPQFLAQAQQRAGQMLEQFGPMETAYDEGGQRLAGQKNLGTGEFANLRDVSPNAPRGSGGGSARAQLPPAAVRQVEYLISKGMPEQEAIDRVFRAYQLAPNPGAEYGRNFRAGYDPMMDNEQQAGDVAGRVTDEASRRSAGASGSYGAPQGKPVRATNPKTGEVVELRNGQWVRVK